ncbi:hypothetical protein ACIGEZ_25735 [Streptomyces sp. NPDC085481]|uniref:hypothetical protein n=1 Tax=Streptomyces sp. NPDC085481 TaxID=3365727 RepID=UPI0037D576FA
MGQGARQHSSGSPVGETAVSLDELGHREAAKLGLKGYKLGRGRNAKVLYKKNEVLEWLDQQKVHEAGSLDGLRL